MELQGIRQKVFLDRYSLKDEAGTAVEQTPEEMWRRVAHAVAKVEKGKKNKDLWEDKFYKAMEDSSTGLIFEGISVQKYFLSNAL